MIIKYHEEFGNQKTILFDPAIEIDRKGGKFKLHETTAWYDGISYDLPEIHAPLNAHVWFCPKMAGYVIGKPKHPGAMLVVWPGINTLHILKYRPKKTALHKRLMFWSKKA